MNLSTPLRRGTLALPMLMLFGLLGFVEVPKARPAIVVGVAQAELLHAVCPTDGGKGRVLVLAQAPADLGNLVIRLRAPCRA